MGFGAFSGMLFSGCSPANKAQTGAGLGALGGGLAGALIGPSKNEEQNALIGAGLGALVGYIIGNEMDKQDQAKLLATFDKTPSYQTTEWVNPDTRNHYAVTPKPAVKKQGRFCREAEIRSIIGGQEEIIVSTACRRPDGRWELQS